MNQLPNETYENWAKRVEQYEYGRALMKLAQGADVEAVLKEVSYRIMKKLNHPVILALTSNSASKYNSEQSQQDYKTNYLDRFGPKPDHIQED
jgi:glutamyl-tRNA reductase